MLGGNSGAHRIPYRSESKWEPWVCGLGGNQADLSFARSEVAPHWAAGDRGFAGRRKSRELARVALLAGGGGRRRSSDSNFLAKAEIGRAIGILTDESARRQ